MERSTTFAEILGKHMEAFHWGLDRLAEASGVPKTTLAGWRSQGKVPRDWQNVVRVAAAFGLDEVQTDELLSTANHPSLQKLNSASLSEHDKQLLSRWTVMFESRADEPSLPASQDAMARTGNESEISGGKSIWHNLMRFLVAIIVIASLIQIALVSSTFWMLRTSVDPRTSSPVNATSGETSDTWEGVRLIEQASGTQLQLEVAGNRIISDGAEISVGELVTASFTIRNEYAYPVTIKKLEAGGRNGHSCTEKNTSKWSGLPEGFPSVRNLVLEPGEEYLYRNSRRYFRTGIYFVEPVRQGDNGKWGGFSPSTCVGLTVSR